MRAKLALGYSTKNQLDLTERTWSALHQTKSNYAFDVFWCDASDAASDAETYYHDQSDQGARVFGGADAAIAWKLSTMLASPENYTHIGLLENDVLLDPDWLEPTLALFEKGKADGLDVGAVSPRSFVDRVLIQRDGFAVMHNIGAGAIIFTREAAGIILRTFRTSWWPDNCRLFAAVSGIDLRTYAAFRGNEQWVTTDWGWEAQLARVGLASLALTPARCTMIGQVPPLAEQGLELTTDTGFESARTRTHEQQRAFDTYRANLNLLRTGKLSLDSPGMLMRQNGGMTVFPHQLGALGASWAGTLGLRWSQGFGPFAYVAGTGGTSLSVRLSGISQFLVAGGSAGARVTITDTRSGFKASPTFPPGFDAISMQVPGGPLPREIHVDMAEGAVFYGLQCEDQMIDPTFRFDWSQLPEPA